MLLKLSILNYLQTGPFHFRCKGLTVTLIFFFLKEGHFFVQINIMPQMLSQLNFF